MRVLLNIARNDMAIVAREPAVYSTFLLMPLLLIAVLEPLFHIALVSEGYGSGSGADLAVPGLTVMFSFFLVTLVGISLLDEYQWNTWPRVQRTSVPPLLLVAAKGIVPMFISLSQQATLFALAAGLFGVRVRGSLFAVAGLSIALACCLVSLGIALIAFATNARQVSVFGNLGTLLFGGLGGSITPVSLLPGWAQDIAPLTPGYWAVRGFRETFLDGAGLGGVAREIGVLAIFTGIFLLIAVGRYASRSERRVV